MNVKIVVPFLGAETKTPIWAMEEACINFRHDFEQAARCTASFAALELKNYLSRTLYEAAISFSSQRPAETFFVELIVDEYAGRDEAFFLQPFKNGISIVGKSRTGLLYGAYEFLRLQGWRWFAPGREGEIVPELRDKPVIPGEKVDYKPSMSLGRGFYFEYVSMESEEFFLWMARNRLNLATYRPLTASLCKKLGMIFKVGGHIFEKILDPDRMMPSGRNLWEEHPDWYGLPADGVRKKEKALNTQFCVSQKDLAEFLGEELLQYLTGKWKDADCVDIWGFDTWGSTCNCSECGKLGNSADQTLHFISDIRTFINKARNEGRLDHDVQMVFCCYEGTSTILGPQGTFAGNLIDSGDYGGFYPINRCYAHDFSDDTCLHNIFYKGALKSWFIADKSTPLMIGEYYNVSKFEDLPLLFTGRIAADLPYYYSMGVRGMTYMHVPLVNWGMRTITQVLFAQLCWDINTDIKSSS